MKVILTIIIFSILPTLYGQKQIRLLNQFDSLQKTSPNRSIVFIHTNWCKYCKQMKYSTLSDSSVVKKINEFGYYFELNAEEKNTISINNVEFYYKPTGNNTGTHELAEELGSINGKLEYPTLVFLNEKHEIIYQKVGFTSKKQLLEILKKLSNK